MTENVELILIRRRNNNIYKGFSFIYRNFDFFTCHDLQMIENVRTRSEMTVRASLRHYKREWVMKVKKSIKRVWIRRRWIARKVASTFVMHIWIVPRRKYFSWRAAKAIRILMRLDTIMVRAEWDRARRRQFWRDFIAHAQTRTDTLNRMASEIRR